MPRFALFFIIWEHNIFFYLIKNKCNSISKVVVCWFQYLVYLKLAFGWFSCVSCVCVYVHSIPVFCFLGYSYFEFCSWHYIKSWRFCILLFFLHMYFWGWLSWLGSDWKFYFLSSSFTLILYFLSFAELLWVCSLLAWFRSSSEMWVEIVWGACLQLSPCWDSPTFFSGHNFPKFIFFLVPFTRETGLSISASICASSSIHLALSESHGNGVFTWLFLVTFEHILLTRVCLLLFHHQGPQCFCNMPSFLVFCGKLFWYNFIPKLPEVQLSIKEI